MRLISFCTLAIGMVFPYGLAAQTAWASNCTPTSAQIDLEINNVRARLLTGGDLWWDPVGLNPNYEVPKGSGKNAISGGSFWIGGFDQSNQLLVAAQTYRQANSHDYWSGPLQVTNGVFNVTANRCADFDRFWKVNRSDVQSFLQTGVASPAIQQWPGSGNISAGELPFLAPFFDANNDGQYDYQDGDYPFFNLSNSYPIDPLTQQPMCNGYLFGDQSIWWVFNDAGNTKTVTNSLPFGIEVRAQAFAWSSPNSILDHTTFYQYQVINRSSQAIDSTYIGVWCDPNLGNGLDDYVGCDVVSGLAYVYNGDTLDEGFSGYGLNPPSVGIDFLGGPLADPGDNTDNDHDGIMDEPGEQILLSNFMHYFNLSASPMGNPMGMDDYYEYLTGSWLDGQSLFYGGNGRGFGPGSTITPCNFAFPDITDPSFTVPWTMHTAGIIPDDMKWIQSAGPFTMHPGSVNYVTTAVVYGRDNAGGPLASLAQMKQADAAIQSLFNSCFTTTSIAEINNPTAVYATPNPFHEECLIDLSRTNGDSFDIQVFSIDGKLMERIHHKNGDAIIIGRTYRQGTFLVNIKWGKNSIAKKIIKL